MIRTSRELSDDSDTLFEMILCAENFCSEVELAIGRVRRTNEVDELRLKISQARNLLEELKSIYDRELLTIENSKTRGIFRQLVLALLWIGYYGRALMSRKLFRKLVLVESSFTYLLV